MKTILSITKRQPLPVYLFFAAFALSLTFCKKDDNPAPPHFVYSVSGNGNGASVVPPVNDATDTATAMISGTYDSTTKVLTYKTTWKDLSGAPTQGGFYNGAMGTNGEILDSAWHFGADTARADSVSGQRTLTQAQASLLIAGNWYYIIGTAKHPDGEVRGQVTLTH